MDDDNEVRDRATFYLSVLAQKQKALNAGYILNGASFPAGPDPAPDGAAVSPGRGIRRQRALRAFLAPAERPCDLRRPGALRSQPCGWKQPSELKHELVIEPPFAERFTLFKSLSYVRLLPTSVLRRTMS